MTISTPRVKVSISQRCVTSLPNLLTLSRIVAMPLVVATFYLPVPEGPWIGCAIFATAGVTDWLDGKLARAWQQQSELGRFLDPIADKVLVAATLLHARGDATDLGLGGAARARHPVPRNPGLGIARAFGRDAGEGAGQRAREMENRDPDGGDRRAARRRFRPGVPSRQGCWAKTLLWIAAAFTLATGYKYLHSGIVHVNIEDSEAARHLRSSAAAKPSRAT